MKFSFVISAMYLACQMALTTSILSAAPQNAGASNSITKNASNSKGHTNEELSRQATRMLQQVDEARQAITNKQTQTAVQHINQAMADCSRIASIARTEHRSVIVPLYSELDDTSVLGPVLASRKGGKQQPSMSAPITVDDASVQYTFVGLDLDKAKSRLEAAKTAIHDNNDQAASDSLAAIGDDLIVQTQQVDLPLLAGRENLGIAETAVKNGTYKEATAALKEASTALDKYAGESSAHHAQEAKDLGTKIDSLSQTVSQNHVRAGTEINRWWHEVDSWFEPPTHS